MRNEAYNGTNFIEIIGEESTVTTYQNKTTEKFSELINLREIIDLIILIIGFIFNILLFVSIILRPLMRTSSGYYVLSLVISNFVLLLDVLDNVLHTWWNIKFSPDVDFIGRVTLQASIHTIAVFSLDRYVTYCRSGTVWHKEALQGTTGLKAILIVWSFASITTAQELHLYEMFRKETVINLYVFFTIMYLVLPTGIILFVGILIVIQIIENSYDTNYVSKIDEKEILGLLCEFNFFLFLLINIRKLI